MSVTERPVPVVDPTGGWRRLSPLMLAVHPVIEVIRALPALLGVLLFGVSQGDGSGALWPLVGVAVVVGVGLLRWATTTYRVTPEQVQVRRGLLRRSVLTVPRDRVRTVDLTAHFMHRMLGLQRITVGTGQANQRGDQALRLDALTTAEAHRLRDELLHQRRTVPHPAGPAVPERVPVPDASAALEPVRPPETVLARLRPQWLRYAPFSLSGLVTIGVVVGFGWRIINDAHLRPEQNATIRAGARELAHLTLPALLIGAAVVLLVLVAVFSTVAYVLTFWGFRLSRTGSGTLHVTRGLLTTRTTTIEEARLRGVELGEPLLLRAVRGARCAAITTGLRPGRGAERGGTLLCPPAPRAEAVRIGGVVLGDRRPLSVPLLRHGVRATRRRFTRALLPALVLLAALAAAWWLGGWPSWPAQAALALVVLAVPLAADRAHNLGHALLTGGPAAAGAAVLVTRHGSLVRRRSTVSGAGVVGWTIRQSYFQRRAGLATLTATTAAGRQHYSVLDVPLPEAVRLADETIPDLLTPFLSPAGPADGR